jgi:hypothetical protein
VNIVSGTPPAAADQPPRRIENIFKTGVDVPPRQTYQPVDPVLTNLDLQQRLLDQAARDLRDWEQRYRFAADLCAQVRTVRQEAERRAAAMAQAEAERAETEIGMEGA